MIRVGLTGGLASGKSFVAETLASLGCLWIEADKLGHQVLEPGGEAHDDVISEFGSAILKEDGSIDRARLAREVFSKPERLEKLSSLVHPPVIRLEEKLIAEFAAREPEGIAVVEAAVLVETGSYQRFDKLIVTRCDLDQQVERAMRRTGATREEVLARMGRQLPAEEKLKVADYVIDTSGTKEETVAQVREVHARLRGEVS